MKRFIRNQSFPRFTRFSVPEYKPEQNDQKFRNWNARLNTIASKPVTKVYLSQLGALMNYYNKQISDTSSVTYLLILAHRLECLASQNNNQRFSR